MLSTIGAMWRLRSARRLLDWAHAHPGHIGLCAVRPGTQEVLASVDEAELFPLASTVKVVHLAAYAERVASRQVAPQEPVPLTDIERWYWPGTDGGAHAAAIKEWRKRGRVSEAGTVALDDVVRAMIRFSSNAAADYMLDRLGPLTTPDGGPVAAVIGQVRGWCRHSVREWSGLSDTERAERSFELASASGEFDLPSAEAQHDYAKTFTPGSPRAWAEFLGRLYGEEDRVVRRHLEWPLESSRTRSLCARYGTKGGSLVGVLTEASYIEPQGGPALAAALFLRDLPLDVWSALNVSYRQQALLQRLAAGKLGLTPP